MLGCYIRYNVDKSGLLFVQLDQGELLAEYDHGIPVRDSRLPVHAVVLLH